MHCPSCGQKQVSNDTKFCSRCGMPLGLVSEVLVHGGYLPQLAELNKAKPTLYTRKNGMLFSLFWFIFFVPLMTSIFGGVLGIEIMGALLALVGCFGALMIFIFSLAFLKPTPRYYPNAIYPGMVPPPPQAMYPGASTALPSHQSVPAGVYTSPGTGAWRDTNDLERGSVTEGTTKLLEKNDLDQ